MNAQRTFLFCACCIEIPRAKENFSLYDLSRDKSADKFFAVANPPCKAPLRARPMRNSLSYPLLCLLCVSFRRDAWRQTSPAMAEASISGWLFKLGEKGLIKAWKKRFCVLESGRVYYYTSSSPEQRATTCKGFIELKTGTTSHNMPIQIVLLRLLVIRRELWP